MAYLTRKHVVALGAGIIVIGFCYGMSVPLDFAPTTVSIEQGASASRIAHTLADAGVTASPLPVWVLLRITSADTRVHAGTYRFTVPEDTFRIVYRLVTADYGLPMARITLQEGETVRDLAEQVAKTFIGISADKFLATGKQYEGYLFPDTYLLPPSSSVDSIIKTMRDNFDARIAPLEGAIATSTHSLSDIVIMASLIEREARTEESRRMVAGILWNRIERGMALQVDAVFGYIKDRDTYSPSLSDLKIDSPYNTYAHKGLPPGPIANPSLSAMQAALYPTKTKYLYYLTGSDNLMHYATTYAGHQANRKQYLNR